MIKSKKKEKNVENCKYLGYNKFVLMVQHQYVYRHESFKNKFHFFEKHHLLLKVMFTLIELYCYYFFQRKSC